MLAHRTGDPNSCQAPVKLLVKCCKATGKLWAHLKLLCIGNVLMALSDTPVVSHQWNDEMRCVAMQTSKEQQDDLALAFTNPFYALLLVVWPWHPRAKRFKHNQATVWKVPCFVCASLECTHTGAFVQLSCSCCSKEMTCLMLRQHCGGDMRKIHVFRYTSLCAHQMGILYACCK